MKKTVGTHAIGFIGAGNMAAALAKGLLATKRHRARDLWASDANPRQLAKLCRVHGVGRAPDNAAIVGGSEIVVLAVKPQVMFDVLEELRPYATRRALFVSIAAGIATERIEAALGGRARVVRAMPNTPSLVGQGMTVVVRGAHATAADEKRAADLFGGVGDVVRIRDEALMDAVTGLSGSGPAYVYRFAEGLIAGAVAQGLDPTIARRLTYQTLRGATAMLLETGTPPEELRAMVSSPGGTTLAGLGALDERGFVDAVAAAIAAATRRGRELGRG